MYKWTAVNWMHVLVFVVMVLAAIFGRAHGGYAYAGVAFGILLGTILERGAETSRRLLTRVRYVGRNVWPFR